MQGSGSTKRAQTMFEWLLGFIALKSKDCLNHVKTYAKCLAVALKRTKPSSRDAIIGKP